MDPPPACSICLLIFAGNSGCQGGTNCAFLNHENVVGDVQTASLTPRFQPLFRLYNNNIGDFQYHLRLLLAANAQAGVPPPPATDPPPPAENISTARRIWDATKEIFGHVGNAVLESGACLGACMGSA